MRRRGPARRVRQDRRWTSALIIDGAEVKREFQLCGAQHSADRRAAGSGHQCLRHSSPGETRADQGGDRCAGGALQMSPKSRSTRHYDVIVAPVITEKATIASERTRSSSGSRRDRHEAPDQGGSRAAFRRQGEGVNTLVRKGKTQDVQAGRAGVHSDMKNAVMTLAEGQEDRRNDRALRGDKETPMALKTFKPITPSLRSSCYRRSQRALQGQAGQGS